MLSPQNNIITRNRPHNKKKKNNKASLNQLQDRNHSKTINALKKNYMVKLRDKIIKFILVTAFAI